MALGPEPVPAPTLGLTSVLSLPHSLHLSNCPGRLPYTLVPPSWAWLLSPPTTPSHSCPQSLTPAWSLTQAHPGTGPPHGLQTSPLLPVWISDYQSLYAPHPAPDPWLPILGPQFWLLAWIINQCYCPPGHRTLLAHLTFSLKCSMAHLYPPLPSSSLHLPYPSLESLIASPLYYIGVPIASSYTWSLELYWANYSIMIWFS